MLHVNARLKKIVKEFHDLTFVSPESLKPFFYCEHNQLLYFQLFSYMQFCVSVLEDIENDTNDDILDKWYQYEGVLENWDSQLQNEKILKEKILIIESLPKIQREYEGLIAFNGASSSETTLNKTNRLFTLSVQGKVLSHIWDRERQIYQGFKEIVSTDIPHEIAQFYDKKSANAL